MRNEITDSILRIIYAARPVNYFIDLYNKIRKYERIKTVTWTDSELLDAGSGDKRYVVQGNDFYVKFDATGKPVGDILYVSLPKAELNHGRTLVLKNIDFPSGTLVYEPYSGERINDFDPASVTVADDPSQAATLIAGGNPLRSGHSWWAIRSVVV